MGGTPNIQTVTVHFNFLNIINYSKRKPKQHSNMVPASLIDLSGLYTSSFQMSLCDHVLFLPII